MTADGGKGSKGRAANGDRPVGAASCRQQQHTMATCQNSHPRGVINQQAMVRPAFVEFLLLRHQWIGVELP